MQIVALQFQPMFYKTLLFQSNNRAELQGVHLCALGVKTGKITYPVMESQDDYGHIYGDIWSFSSEVKECIL